MSSARWRTKASGLSAFERNLLVNNACPALINMKCIFEGDEVEIIYDTGGMQTLSQIIGKYSGNPEGILSLCGDVLQALLVCRDHLITEEDLSLKDGDIFLAGEQSGVRFRYIPGGGGGMTAREKLVEMADMAVDCYGSREGMVEWMSVYKRKLYDSGGHDLQDLMSITDQCIRIYHEAGKAREPGVRQPMMVREEAAEYIADPVPEKRHRFLDRIKEWMDEVIS